MLYPDYRPRRALAPRGKPAILVRPGLIPQPCSITLLTSLNTESLFYWTVRYGSNTQFDFLESVKAMIDHGALKSGDILVMDNAAVHLGRASRRELKELLTRAEVGSQLLPTYSPELNPCEFVFARIKNFIRSPLALQYDPDQLREVTRDFAELLEDATSRITHQSMINTYGHCSRINENSEVFPLLIQQGLAIPVPE